MWQGNAWRRRIACVFCYKRCMYSAFFLAVLSSIPVCGIIHVLTRVLDVGSLQLAASKPLLPRFSRVLAQVAHWQGTRNSSRIAYALLCTESHWHYVYVLAHRIRNITRIKHDLLILTPERLPARLMDLFGPNGLNAIILHVTLEPPATVQPLEPAFKVSWIKLHLFTLTSYDKILYLDSDVLLLKDISPIFQVNSFASVSLACDASLDLAGLNGGILLIKPNVSQYSELLALAETPSPTNWHYSEQELLSMYFVWLHPELFVPLSTHFMIPYYGLTDHGLLGIHEFFGRHWLFHDKTNLDMLSRIYTVHFICGKKPWQRSPDCGDVFGKQSARCAAVRMWHQHARDASLWYRQ
jgi:hypothetical protein